MPRDTVAILLYSIGLTVSLAQPLKPSSKAELTRHTFTYLPSRSGARRRNAEESTEEPKMAEALQDGENLTGASKPVLLMTKVLMSGLALKTALMRTLRGALTILIALEKGQVSQSTALSDGSSCTIFSARDTTECQRMQHPVAFEHTPVRSQKGFSKTGTIQERATLCVTSLLPRRVRPLWSAAYCMFDQ